MTKSQVDLENRQVYIPDSKTLNGIGEMPISPQASEAFRAQMELAKDSEYLFPSPSKRSRKPFIASLKKTWGSTLRRAGVPYFPLYQLRHTFATRLSAG